MKTEAEIEFMADELKRLKYVQSEQYTQTTAILNKMGKPELIKTVLALTAMLFEKESQ